VAQRALANTGVINNREWLANARNNSFKLNKFSSICINIILNLNLFADWRDSTPGVDCDIEALWKNVSSRRWPRLAIAAL
jgi:hypothetical protein